MPRRAASGRTAAKPSTSALARVPPLREVGGQRRRLHAPGRRLPRDARRVGALEIGDRVQPGAGRPQPERAPAVPRGRGGERLQALAVRHAHAPQVAREVALADEVGQHRLVEHRRMLVGGGAGRHQPVLQVGRHDQEAQAQRREQRLAEAADVDHAAVDVEPVQARHRPRAVAELAVVVVLDHPGARAARPAQQGQPPRQAHRHAQRILVRRRHVGEPRVAARRARPSRRRGPRRPPAPARCARPRRAARCARPG